MTDRDISEGRILAVVAYLTIFGSLISLFLNNDKKNPFVAFHTRQGLGLCILYMLIALVINPLDHLGVYIGFWIFMGILFLYGIIGAVSGKLYEVPILGPMFQNWFKGIGR